jgi:hypothetical protein
VNPQNTRSVASAALRATKQGRLRGGSGRAVPLLLAALICLTFGRAVDAQVDPAAPACEQAIRDGYYTVELYGQCLDDFRDSSGS